MLEWNDFNTLPDKNALLLVSDGVAIYTAFWYIPHGLTQINPLLRNGTEPRFFTHWVYVEGLLNDFSEGNSNQDNT